MRGQFTTLFSFLLFITQGQPAFQKIIATNSDYDGEKICKTKSGGYAIAGSTNAGNWDIHLVKLKYDGSMQWSAQYGGPTQELAYALTECPDGGFITVGASGVMGTNSPPLYDVYAQKTDSNGALLWAYTYGGPVYDGGNCVIRCKGGGYLIAGETSSFGAGSADVYILKIDELGNLLWTRTIGGTGIEQAYSVIQARNGDFIMSGATGSFKTENSEDLYLARLDSTGTLLWTRTVGGSGYYAGYSIIESTDGGIVVAGETDKGIGNPDAFVVKTDSAGNVRWAKAYGGASVDLAKDLVESKDGQYVIAGVIGNQLSGWQEQYLFKVDTGGNLTWAQKIRANGPARGNSLAADAGNGFVISGIARDSMQPDVCLYVTHVDSTGQSACAGGSVSTAILPIGNVGSGGVAFNGGTRATASPSVKQGFAEYDFCAAAGIQTTTINPWPVIYPNPGKGLFYLAREARELILTDGCGSLVFRGQHLSRLDLSALLPGVYFATIITNTGTAHQKLVLAE